jgi:hypothetical protein
MLSVIVGVFMVLHGVVHGLYFGQSWRLFELTPGLVWPDGSWAFSRLLGNDTTRLLASAALVVAAVGFGAGGIAILAKQAWWRPAVVGAAVFSSALFLLLWDGGLGSLDDKGGVGLLINLLILGAVLLLHWPDFAF